MDKARIAYPDPEELYIFFENKFVETIDKARELSEVHQDDKIRDLLEMIEGAVFMGDHQCTEGATYKSLAFVAHQYGLSDQERQGWYRVAKWLPLSQAHVSYITRNTIERNQIFSDLNRMTERQG